MPWKGPMHDNGCHASSTPHMANQGSRLGGNAQLDALTLALAEGERRTLEEESFRTGMTYPDQ